MIVKDYPKYNIEKDGSIYSYFSFKYLKTLIDSYGYVKIMLYNKKGSKQFFLHRLLAEHFLLKLSHHKDVNHIDGNKSNNNLQNLEWVTRSENNKHAYKLGLKCKKGEKHHSNKLKNKDILKIRKLLIKGIKQTIIAKEFNVDQSTISYIKRNKTWSHI